MSNKSYAQMLEPSSLMRCSVCNHYVGEHHDKGCAISSCDCGNGFYDMVKDMRYRELRGYVESFSHDTKIAVQIGSSYHIFGIPEAEELARFIFGLIDVAKMTAIPQDKRCKCWRCAGLGSIEKDNAIENCPACEGTGYG